MFCPQCGQQLPENAVFCRGCGQRVAEDQAPEQAPVIQQAPAAFSDAAYQQQPTPSAPVYAVAQPAQAAQAPAPKKRSGVAMGFAIGLAFVAALAAGLGLFQFLKGTQEADAAGMAKMVFDLDVGGETSQEALAQKDISIPLEIEGTTKDGKDISAVLVYRPGRDVITLPTGSYRVRMIGAPVDATDTVYTYPEVEYQIDVGAQDPDDEPVVVSPEQPIAIDPKPDAPPSEVEKAKQDIEEVQVKMEEELGDIAIGSGKSGSAPASPSSSSSSSSSSTSASSTAAPKADKAKMREAYLTYLRAAKDICDKGSTTEKPTVGVHSDLHGKKPAQVRYAFYDVNGDGLEELVIAPAEGEPEAGTSSRQDVSVLVYHVLASSDAATGAVAEVAQSSDKRWIALYQKHLVDITSNGNTGYTSKSYCELDGATAKLKTIEVVESTRQAGDATAYKHKDATGKETAIDEAKAKEINQKYAAPPTVQWHLLSTFDEQETREEFAAIDQGPEAHKKYMEELLSKREQEHLGGSASEPATPANPTSLTVARDQEVALSGTLVRVDEGTDITMMAWGRVVYYLEFPEPVSVTYTEQGRSTTKDMTRISVCNVEVYDVNGDGTLDKVLSQTSSAEWEPYVGSTITVSGTVTNTGNAHTPGLCMYSKASVV